MNDVLKFSNDKNEKVLEKHGVSFQEAIIAIHSGDLLDIIDNPNQRKYPNESAFIVYMKNYVYVVPFVLKKNIIELKTVFPSRKYAKIYGAKNEKR